MQDAAADVQRPLVVDGVEDLVAREVFGKVDRGVTLRNAEPRRNLDEIDIDARLRAAQLLVLSRTSELIALQVEHDLRELELSELRRETSDQVARLDVCAIVQQPDRLTPRPLLAGHVERRRSCRANLAVGFHLQQHRSRNDALRRPRNDGFAPASETEERNERQAMMYARDAHS